MDEPHLIQEILISTFRLSLPLLFAAFGGMLSERSGVANIALESYLLFSAFTAAAVTSLTSNLAIGIGAGLLASALVAAIYAAVCIWGRGDQIVIGTAFNFAASGLIPVFCRTLFGATGATPSLPFDLRIHHIWIFVGLGVLLIGYYHFIFTYTRYGLQIKAAGENPHALFSQGVNVQRLRLRAVIEGGLIAGLGGVVLSLCLSSAYTRDMSAGRGFIALAALIFGGWRPIPTALACLFFGLTDALQIQVQGQAFGAISIANQWIQISPYVVTLLVLAVSSRRMRAPLAANRDLFETMAN